LKTSIFLVTLLLTKLVISFFLSALGTAVPVTLVFGFTELLSRVVGFCVVYAFLQELKTVFPEISHMFFTASAMEPETKRDLVGEAVWC
jgi:hypothetical protein